MRTDWADLPEAMRSQIEAKTGPIDRIDPAPRGNHADIASTLFTASGPVFVKTARKLQDRDGPEVMSLQGRPAGFAPGSPDLEVLAKTIHAIHHTPCPLPVRLLVERRWQRFTDDVTPLTGNALLHTDLNQDNSSSRQTAARTWWTGRLCRCQSADRPCTVRQAVPAR